MSKTVERATAAPGETLCRLVNLEQGERARARWDGNGGVTLRGMGKDGKPWCAEFHHVVGDVFEIVKVEGSTGRLRTLSRSSSGMRMTTTGVLRELDP